jgi:very-short-patch-repair endonuclease
MSAFKGYLEFARSGRLERGATGDADAFESPFEAEVAYVLRQAGYKVATQVGVAGYFLDLAVRHPSNPDHFVLGVECDGATYHSARCARDRDKLRQQILESLGWNIFRIWSTDWFADRPREVEKLKAYLERLLKPRRSDGALR